MTEDEPQYRAVKAEELYPYADFRKVDLREADLGGANLEGVDFSGAYLSAVNLRKAYLAGADLREANLIGADLAGAYLSGADFSDTKFSETVLYGVDLSHVTGLRQHQLEETFGDSETRIPPNLKRPAHWLCHPYDNEDENEDENENKDKDESQGDNLVPPSVQQRIQQDLSASSPVGFALRDDLKIHIEDTPLDVPPEQHDPREQGDLIQALNAECIHLNEELHLRRYNFDSDFICRNLARYAEALTREKLSWYLLDSKTGQIIAMMKREDAENSWDPNIVTALHVFVELHCKLEPFIRPEQPKIPVEPPAINTEKLESEGLSPELPQKLAELSDSPEFQEITSPETQEFFIELAEEAPENKHDPNFLIKMGQGISAFLTSLETESAKLANIARNVGVVMFQLTMIYSLIFIFFIS